MQDATRDFKAWYMAKPLFTRSFLAACVALTVIITFGLVSPMALFFTFETTFFQLNLWRPITALFFMGKFSFNLIFQLYFAYMALTKVETMVFSRETYADFLWLTLCSWISLIVISSIIPLYFFNQPFTMIMVYIWCKRMPHQTITLMFGLQVKTGYFPWVYMIMMSLFGGDWKLYLIGIALGHLYIFIKDIAVVKYHKDYLPTPKFFSNWWYQRAGVPQRANPAAAAFNIFSGQGVRLE